jgi:hypothetical protein
MDINTQMKRLLNHFLKLQIVVRIWLLEAGQAGPRFYVLFGLARLRPEHVSTFQILTVFIAIGIRRAPNGFS